MSVPQLVLSTEHSTPVPSKSILKRRPSAPSTLQRSSSWLSTLNSRIGSALHGNTDTPLTPGEQEHKLEATPGNLARFQTVDSVSFPLSRASISPKLALDR